MTLTPKYKLPNFQCALLHQYEINIIFAQRSISIFGFELFCKGRLEAFNISIFKRCSGDDDFKEHDFLLWSETCQSNESGETRLPLYVYHCLPWV